VIVDEGNDERKKGWSGVFKVCFLNSDYWGGKLSLAPPTMESSTRELLRICAFYVRGLETKFTSERLHLQRGLFALISLYIIFQFSSTSNKRGSGRRPALQ
jgi:hypothetical protein